MARVLVYNRSVDAIFMDVNLGVKTNLSEQGIIRIKEEPIENDSYDDLWLNEIEAENENEASRSEDCESEESKIEDNKIENNKTTNDKIEDEVSNANYEYKSYVPPQEFDPLKNNTLNTQYNLQYLFREI